MQRSFERGHCLSLRHQPFSVSVLTNSISSSSRDVGLAVAVGLGTKSLIGSGSGAGAGAELNLGVGFRGLRPSSLVDFDKAQFEF